jgi:hypothetical protein
MMELMLIRIMLVPLLLVLVLEIQRSSNASNLCCNRIH